MRIKKLQDIMAFKRISSVFLPITANAIPMGPMIYTNIQTGLPILKTILETQSMRQMTKHTKDQILITILFFMLFPPLVLFPI